MMIACHEMRSVFIPILAPQVPDWDGRKHGDRRSIFPLPPIQPQLVKFSHILSRICSPWYFLNIVLFSKLCRYCSFGLEHSTSTQFSRESSLILILENRQLIGKQKRDSCNRPQSLSIWQIKTSSQDLQKWTLKVGGIKQKLRSEIAE